MTLRASSRPSTSHAQQPLDLARWRNCVTDADGRSGARRQLTPRRRMARSLVERLSSSADRRVLTAPAVRRWVVPGCGTRRAHLIVPRHCKAAKQSLRSAPWQKGGMHGAEGRRGRLLLKPHRSDRRPIDRSNLGRIGCTLLGCARGIDVATIAPLLTRITLCARPRHTRWRHGAVQATLRPIASANVPSSVCLLIRKSALTLGWCDLRMSLVLPAHLS